MIIAITGRLRREEMGYTITELMVVILILSILLGAFYSFLFGGERAARDGRQWLEMNQTARLAFERLSRELREADQITEVDPLDVSRKVSFRADFNNDGTYSAGTYSPTITDDEKLIYEYLPASRQITVDSELADVEPEVLATNISSFSLKYYGNDPRADCAVGDPPVFTVTCTPDGIITWQELDRAADYGLSGYGNANDKLDVEFPLITSVVIEMTVTVANQNHRYRTAVELRNVFKV